MAKKHFNSKLLFNARRIVEYDLMEEKTALSKHQVLHGPTGGGPQEVPLEEQLKNWGCNAQAAMTPGL